MSRYKPQSKKLRANRRGFTLAESLISMTVLSITGSALMLGISSSLQNAEAARERAIATGIAEQMIDEVLGALYVVPGGSPYQVGFGPSSWESSGPGRSRFNDTDDYHGYSAQALENLNGGTLGEGNGSTGQRLSQFRIGSGYFSDWKQEFEITYVDADDPQLDLTGSSTSDFRAVEVRISREVEAGVYRNLVTLRRVFAYVPPASS